jgi:coenzyme F420-reducing hydrogenase beta subunit
MDITTVINEKFCNGCSACMNKCKFNAISIECNSEGFLYPVIDKIKCTNCGMCNKVCSYINNKSDNLINPKCYMFLANDEERKYSSSGGVFSVLAKHFLMNDGYVCGAIWTKDWKVKHIITNSLEDLNLLKSSKYIQRGLVGFLKEAEIYSEK